MINMHTQYCFSNFSGTNERIFIKFETKAVSIAINQYVDFHNDPCTHVHVKGKNAHSYSFH